MGSNNFVLTQVMNGKQQFWERHPLQWHNSISLICLCLLLNKRGREREREREMDREGGEGGEWVRKDSSVMKFEGNGPDQLQTQFFLSRVMPPGYWMLPSGTKNMASIIFLHQRFIVH